MHNELPSVDIERASTSSQHGRVWAVDVDPRLEEQELHDVVVASTCSVH